MSNCNVDKAIFATLMKKNTDDPMLLSAPTERLRSTAPSAAAARITEPTTGSRTRGRARPPPRQLRRPSALSLRQVAASGGGDGCRPDGAAAQRLGLRQAAARWSMVMARLEYKRGACGCAIKVACSYVSAAGEAGST